VLIGLREFPGIPPDHGTHAETIYAANAAVSPDCDINQLMVDLGFGSGYVAQGGDIGSRIARILAVQYDACKGRSPIPFLPSLSLNITLSSGPCKFLSYIPTCWNRSGVALAPRKGRPSPRTRIHSIRDGVFSRTRNETKHHRTHSRE
jgi:hypothetical protein